MSTVSSELALHDIIPGGKPILLMKSIWTDSRQASKSLLVIGGRGVLWWKARNKVSVRVL